MFKAIKRAIWGRHEDEPQIVATHNITNPSQITALLIQAFKAHTLFNADFTDQGDLFNTALLGIYEEYGFLVLDEINPSKGHELLIETGEAVLTGRVDGVEMRFHAKLIEARKKNNVYFYKMEIPKQVHFLQRRKDYRITTRGVQIPFRAHGKYDHQLLNGYVNDLSRSGIGLTIDEVVHLKKGDILPTCKITIPNGGQVIFSLEICFSWKDTFRGITRIGGRFQNLDRHSLQQVRKTINQMERARAKRLHGV